MKFLVMIMNDLMGYIYEQTHSTVHHVEFVIGLSVTLVLNGISVSKQEKARSTSPDTKRYIISTESGSPNVCSSTNLLFFNYLKLLDKGPTGLKNVED
jgi:hypothetical protein